jgi:hypothetical protein
MRAVFTDHCQCDPHCLQPSCGPVDIPSSQCAPRLSPLSPTGFEAIYRPRGSHVYSMVVSVCSWSWMDRIVICTVPFSCVGWLISVNRSFGAFTGHLKWMPLRDLMWGFHGHGHGHGTIHRSRLQRSCLMDSRNVARPVFWNTRLPPMGCPLSPSRPFQDN